MRLSLAALVVASAACITPTAALAQQAAGSWAELFAGARASSPLGERPEAPRLSSASTRACRDVVAPDSIALVGSTAEQTPVGVFAERRGGGAYWGSAMDRGVHAPAASDTLWVAVASMECLPYVPAGDLVPAHIIVERDGVYAAIFDPATLLVRAVEMPSKWETAEKRIAASRPPVVHARSTDGAVRPLTIIRRCGPITECRMIALDSSAASDTLRAIEDRNAAMLAARNREHREAGLAARAERERLERQETEEAARVAASNRRRSQQAMEARTAEINAKPWPSEMKRLVVARQVRIGMTAEMVRLSWGSPTRVNSTVLPSGRREQWVYSDDYVYLDNGVVAAIQTSRPP